MHTFSEIMLGLFMLRHRRIQKNQSVSNYTKEIIYLGPFLILRDFR